MRAGILPHLMASELSIRSPRDSRVVALERDRYVLGRLRSSDLPFPDDGSLSKQHLAFERDGQGWAVVDLGSRNGTFLNGTLIAGRQRLQPGDTVRAGHDHGDARAPSRRDGGVRRSWRTRYAAYGSPHESRTGASHAAGRRYPRHRVDVTPCGAAAGRPGACGGAPGVRAVLDDPRPGDRGRRCTSGGSPQQRGRPPGDSCHARRWVSHQRDRAGRRPAREDVAAGAGHGTRPCASCGGQHRRAAGADAHGGAAADRRAGDRAPVSRQAHGVSAVDSG